MRTIAVSLMIAAGLVITLAVLYALYPTPSICYGVNIGVPYPYHPIPCGTFPLFH